MEWLHQVFGVEHMLTWWQECARAVLIFVYGLLLVRLLGRRVFGKWAAIDIVVAIIVGSNLSRALTGSAPLFGTLAACLLLMVINWVFAQAGARWEAFSSAMEGDPVELVSDGVVRADRLRASGVSMTDLNESLRNASLDGPEKAAKVTLEPSGRITVVKKQDESQSGAQYP